MFTAVFPNSIAYIICTLTSKPNFGNKMTTFHEDYGA